MRLGQGTLVKQDWGPLAPTDRSTAGAWSLEYGVRQLLMGPGMQQMDSAQGQKGWNGEGSWLWVNAERNHCRPAWEATASPAFSLVLTFFQSSWPV